MNQFASIRDAKEFVVARIVEEAASEGVPLSEIERKMLYFSETDWTLPDFSEVSDAFHREYDDREYERKIARLIRNARTRAIASHASSSDGWSDALEILKEGDHYLLVLARRADAAEPGFNWAVLALVVAVVCGVGLLLAGLSAYLGHDAEHDPDVIFFIWAAAASVTATYLLLRFLVGGPGLDRLVNRVLGKLLR
jgi:hypothetical protein